MKKQLLSRIAKDALKADEKAREDARKKAGVDQQKVLTADSFQNFSAGLGIGANNLGSAATYGFYPISRIRTELEWIHRGSWLGGVAIDLVADDMTRGGVEIKGDLEPEEIGLIDEGAVTHGIWNSVNDAIKWARLYGGSLAVMLIEGQDMATPLQPDRIKKGQFKGLMVLDRWMVEPSLNRLANDLGPNLGRIPMFYTVNTTAPSLFGQKIHYSRCLRLEGIRLPYWQALQENLWGISVLERLYDRMVALDSATAGAAQMVYRAHLRTYKIKGLREVISSGGEMLNGLLKQIQFMRQQQSIEGITLMDLEDEFENFQPSFSGLSDALLQFIQQLAGALQIPLVRLLGQSPAGLNSTGESDLRTYYDGIKQQQVRNLLHPMTIIYRIMALSLGIQVKEGFGIDFRPLWQLQEKEKADVAQVKTQTILEAHSAGVIGDQLALQELKQASGVTGVWTNVTREDIEGAEREPAPPADELLPAEEEGKEGKEKENNA